MARCKAAHPCFIDGICRFTGSCENRVITNADRLRNMNDRELASFIAKLYVNEAIRVEQEQGRCVTATEISVLTERINHIWLSWLRSDAEVE